MKNETISRSDSTCINHGNALNLSANDNRPVNSFDQWDRGIAMSNLNFAANENKCNCTLCCVNAMRCEVFVCFVILRLS